MAANIFTGATSNLWGTAANWSLLAVPTGVDGNVATFNIASPACTVNTTTKSCNSIDFSAYTNTITLTTGILIYGAVTLGASMTFAGTSSLTSAATGTLTSNGKTFPNTYGTTASMTLTLADNWTVGGFNPAGGGIVTVNGNTLYIAGNLTQNASLAGTTAIQITSTSTVSYTGSAYVANNLTFNAGASTITISSLYKNGGTLLYTSGTLSWGTSTLSVTGTTTLTLGSQTPYNLTLLGTSTVTLSANLTITNLLTSTTSTNTLNGNTIYVKGLTVSGNLAGTTTIEMNNGTWSGVGTLANNLVFNATTFTVSGGVNKNGGTITYTAGTPTVTGSTVTVSGDTTFNTNGMSWNNISPTGTRTITINSLLTVTGTWTTVATTTFAGTAGFSIATFTCTTAGVTITFKNGVTYTSTTAVTMTGTNASRIVFTSDHATIKAIWTLNGGATQLMAYVNGTRIDSSLGQTIWSFGGTLTDTINWMLLTTPSSMSYGFVY